MVDQCGFVEDVVAPVDDGAVAVDEEDPRFVPAAVGDEPLGDGVVERAVVELLPDLDVDERGAVGVAGGEFPGAFGDRSAEPRCAVCGGWNSPLRSTTSA
ncbi:hypothetical protein [Actinomarinicola tropica]|uniref:hypothetical protein n=1 Tax=Actinomarinicola tropica TaxID=2789776 RepID=UPI001E4E5671|nr:hypothetical protein [Actinomarinicola tropica]